MDLRNTCHVFVGKDEEGSALTTRQAYDKGLSTFVADGQIVVVTNYGEVVNGSDDVVIGTSKVDTIKLVKNEGGQLIHTPEIKVKNVKSYKVSTYTAREQQISRIGNGTSAFTTVLTANTDYSVRLVRKDNDLCSYEKIRSVTYRPTSTPTQSSIVLDLTKSMALNYSGTTTGRTNDHDLQVRIRRKSDATSAVLTTVVSMTFTEGSRFCSYDTADAAIVVGDFLKTPATLSDGSSTATHNIYKIISIDTTNKIVELDIPYQDVSATVLVGDLYVITAANAIAGASDWGIEVEGKDQLFVPGAFRYDVTRFILEVMTPESITTAVSEVNAATRGVGTYEEAAENEWYGKGYYGVSSQYKVNSVNNSRSLQATSGVCYDVLSITYNNTGVQNFTGTFTHEGIVTVYMPKDRDAYEHTTNGLVHILDKIFEDAGYADFNQSAYLTA